ncbi:MAG: DUF1207 domain-containing protein [Deltaproteobacteria bacterium]|nr:DUF1207 domain-containing protein [Deltaproteobacteria bacterium]
MKPSLFLLTTLLLCALCDANELQLKLVPRGRPFQLTFADPREIKMALSFEGDSRINAMIGNYFSLFGLQSASNPDNSIHVGLEGAGYFSMVEAERRFPLETSDGLIGTYIEGRVDNWQWQFRYTHVSAHLADGSSDTPIPYSREHIAGRLAYFPTPDIDLYAGVYCLVNSVPVVAPLGFQIGLNYFSPWSAVSLTPFFGADLQWKEQSSVNPTASIELGVAMSNPRERYRSLRIFYAYLTGSDPRGQYFTRVTTTHSLGIEMQI